MEKMRVLFLMLTKEEKKHPRTYSNLDFTMHIRFYPIKPNELKSVPQIRIYIQHYQYAVKKILPIVIPILTTIKMCFLIGLIIMATPRS